MLIHVYACLTQYEHCSPLGMDRSECVSSGAACQPPIVETLKPREKELRNFIHSMIY